MNKQGGMNMSLFTYNKAINYSGYRENQSPLDSTYPSKEEILEDLRILEGDYYYLRIYDCSTHGIRTLEVITEYKLNFKVMLGLFMHAEVNHKNHPFFYIHKEDVLEKNKSRNEKKITDIINLANKYRDIVSSISVGNETRSMWNNNRVSEERLVYAVNRIKEETKIPVTFCEEYQHWVEGLENLAQAVDFISLHTYPAWQGSEIDGALDIAVKNYNQVQDKYPNKECIITETGWPTSSHGSKIKVELATIENQIIYNNQITKWGKESNTLVYLFEAFDEPWKGGKDPKEPEKNWGIYTVDRKKKK